MTKKPKPKKLDWIWVKMQIEKERLEKKPLHKGR